MKLLLTLARWLDANPTVQTEVQGRLACLLQLVSNFSGKVITLFYVWTLCEHHKSKYVHTLLFMVWYFIKVLLFNLFFIVFFISLALLQ